jgi:hypothetical protein
MKVTIIWLILIMLILYLPQILRGRQPKKYEYPDIPDKIDLPKTNYNIPPLVAQPPLLEVKKPAGQPPGLPKVVAIKQEFEETTLVMPENTARETQFEQTAVLNGIIFSEILQSPRALRPLRPIRGKR